MTRIDFYTHVEDKLQTACRLCAKAVSQGMKVTILTPDGKMADTLDDMLWRHPATGFLPHCAASSELAPVTPVILCQKGEPQHHDDVLLNLQSGWPSFFSRFSRVIEIVSTDSGDSAAARERFRFYKDRGYEIYHHDLGKAA